MALQWVTGRIVGRQVWADGLFTLSVQCPGVNAFEPGQFLQVGFPLADKHLHRPYSVASPHGEVLDFFIVRVDGGELTPKLWELQCGDSLDVSLKGTGSFTLKHVPDAETLWLVATGTGLAPYVAMLRTTEIWERFPRIVLAHGVRLGADLAYLEELARFKSLNPGRFEFLPIVSREELEGSVSGRITTAMDSGELELRAGAELVPGKSVVMMCGNPQMLNDFESRLVDRGMVRHRSASPGSFVLERYW